MSELIMLVGLLLLIVLIHEAGHLIIAKIFKVGVPVYSIGFGPRLIGFKFYRGLVSYRILNNPPSLEEVWAVGETEYRLAPIPFGGFCSMEGEVVESKNPSNRDLASKPFYQKVLVALGGAAANISTGLLAIILVLMPKFGFINGVKGAVLWSIDSVKSTFYYTYLLVIGQEPLAQWSEISGNLSNVNHFEDIVVYFGILSIIMALFNLIPFPALDGSLPFLWSLEKIFGKNLGQRLAQYLVAVGFWFLMIVQAIMVIYWIVTA